MFEMGLSIINFKELKKKGEMCEFKFYEHFKND